MTRLKYILGFVLAAATLRAQSYPIIIDTDAGSDDLMAISFLLSDPGVRIEAVTIANGLVHVDAGARNLLRLLDLAGRKNVPVFAGRPAPLRGTAEFPAEWRKLADELPGVTLPPLARQPEKQRAADYLVERLRDHERLVRILALGPLTNLAEALEREPRAAGGIQELVIMGGAVRVPGNLADGDVLKTPNKTAEWNMYVDPLAARMVFRSHANIRLIPLDATNKVRIDAAFLREFTARAQTPLGRVVAQVLESDRKFIDEGFFYAWDPLAAMALVHPAVVKTIPLHIDIRQDSPEEGRTAQAVGEANARVAIDADRAAFLKFFLDAFAR